MLEEGRAHRARTGTSLMVPRDAIVPIPAHVRERLQKQNVEMLAANAVEMFPAETAQSMFDFRAEDVVGKIAPRPLLLIHAANDSVTPTEQSIALFERAGQPAELHLFSGVDHFLFNEPRGSGMCCAAGSTPTFRRARDHNAALISIAGERRVSQSKIIVGHEELSRFVRDALEGKGVRPEDAAVVADGLVWANLRGIDGHGVSRLP